MHIIYKITNKTNNKIYIGQTNNLVMRKYQYKCAAKTDCSGMIVVKAIQKYGFDNFIFEEIATCKTLEDVNETEILVINQYNSTNSSIGYNIEPGGKNNKRSAITVEKVRQALLKYYESHNHANKGKSLNDEWKKAISVASMGKAGTNKGKKFSTEWSLKIAKSQLNKKVKQKFSIDEQKKICDLYESGDSSVVLSRNYNCAKTTIMRILKRNNIKIRPSNNDYRRSERCLFSFEKEIEIYKIYNEGKDSYVSLGEKFNCSSDVSRAIVIRHTKKD